MTFAWVIVLATLGRRARGRTRPAPDLGPTQLAGVAAFAVLWVSSPASADGTPPERTPSYALEVVAVDAVGAVVGDIPAAAMDAALLAGPAPMTKPEHAVRWYGWQTLAADAALLGGGAYLASRPRTTDPGKHEYTDLLYTAVGWYAFSWIGVPI